MKRILGRSGIEVSSLGLGCWAVGGPWKFDAGEAGWGTVDDRESVAAIQAGMALGVNFFDTAANYGAGHSERILGQAIAGKRDSVVIATKFGYGVFEDRGLVSGMDASPAAIRASLEASLGRLGTDYIDLFQLHVGDYPLERVPETLETLDALVAEGKVRAYGWSTDDPERARSFAEGQHCATVQHQLNLFEDNPEMLALCESLNLASINRGPLAMGLLTGKYKDGATFEASDLRAHNHAWMAYFKDGKANSVWTAKLEAMREVLTSNGRTLAQGALAWLWARSPMTVPIPGFRTVAQAESNAKAMEFGALTSDQMLEVKRILEG
jgi:aryl-alcohol dehydrogenase-like predicted oxidoreductase